MIEVRVNTRKEAAMMANIIDTGLRNSSKERLKQIQDYIGKDKLDVTYHIKQNEELNKMLNEFKMEKICDPSGELVTITDGKSYIKYQKFDYHCIVEDQAAKNDDFMTMDFRGLFPATPYAELYDIYVHPDDRKKGLGTALVQMCVKDCEDYCVLVAVGASMKEYPEEPSDDDKIRITAELTGFYEKNNFADVNDHIAGYEFKRAMMYIGETDARKVYEKMITNADNSTNKPSKPDEPTKCSEPSKPDEPTKCPEQPEDK